VAISFEDQDALYIAGADDMRAQGLIDLGLRDAVAELVEGIPLAVEEVTDTHLALSTEAALLMDAARRDSIQASRAGHPERPEEAAEYDEQDNQNDGRNDSKRQHQL
jgi:hypothetical protein